MWLLSCDALRKQFTGSVLGVWWAIVKPILFVGVYGVFVQEIFRPTIGSVYGPHGYLFLVMSGVGAWTLLAEPLTAAAGSIAINAPLLTKALFPIEVLPVARILAAAVSGTVALFLLVLLLGLHGRLGVWVVMLPGLILVQLLFVVGLGWVAATISVTLPDVIHALPFVLNIWMMLSPVIYSPDMLPLGWDWLGMINPMWPIIGVYRSLLLDNAAPDPMHLMAIGVWAVASVVIGYTVFTKRRTMFSDMI